MPCAVAHSQESVVTEIEVSRIADKQLPLRFRVRLVDEDGSSTEHDVTLSRVDHERLSVGYPTTEAFVSGCFQFLLEREAKESILPTFDVRQISTYFPEFDHLIVHA
jgi:hypothetical protein